MSAPASISPAALQIIVIPGNPGSCRFYAAFMEALYSNFGGSADVVAVSHAGHEEGSGGDKCWTLDCQVSHKVDFLRQHVLLPGAPPAVVVAHSIGSYMMLHALRQLEEEGGGPAVAKVVLCKPFLRTNPGCARQRLIRAASARAHAVAFFAGHLGAAPEALKPASRSTRGRRSRACWGEAACSTTSTWRRTNLWT
ncbi:MAG: hypothetical protein J3K34DRAFT_401470 [Monoraphidium minutum]|nr:MAG: hypothetical protein J3K34DRAFT_401470 [Monoraphidium minutum]